MYIYTLYKYMYIYLHIFYKKVITIVIMILLAKNKEDASLHPLLSTKRCKFSPALNLRPKSIYKRKI